MKEYKVPIQSLIDHIKTACDVDPWAKEMAEELLKKQEAVKPERTVSACGFHYDFCGACNCVLPVSPDYDKANFCPLCGRPVNWDWG